MWTCRHAPALLTAAATAVIGGAVTQFAPPPAPNDGGAPLDADPAIAQVDLRSRTRDLVVREMTAGRMTLPEAAAAFGWLDRLTPPIPTPLPCQAALTAGLPD